MPTMITTLLLAASLFTLPAQKSDATIGITAINLETGERISVRGSEHFPMGSVYKFPIALAVLRRVDAGTLSLAQKVTIDPKEFPGGVSAIRDRANGKSVTYTVGELLEAMTVESDNTACDALLRVVGGPRAVTTRMAELGASGVHVDRTEKEIGTDLKAPGYEERYGSDVRDSATPDAMADLLVAFWKGRDGLSRQSHDLLAKWMIESPTGARKLRTALPNGWSVAHKSGQMPRTSNDAGVLISPGGKQHIAIALFSKNALDDVKLVDADLVEVTRAVLARWAK
ncbi:MAG TPA: class A beta-lactamase [Thermoanaerobaculia bacterium]